MVGSNLLITLREAQMGILKHMVLIAKGDESFRKSLRELGWRLLRRWKLKIHINKGISTPNLSQ